MSGETIRDVIIKVAIQAGDSSSFKSVAEELQRDLQSKIGGIDVKPFGEHAVEEMRAITTAAKEAASAIASVHGHPGIGMPGYGASVTNRASSIISQNISQMKSESGGAGLDDQHWAKLEARMQKQAESFIREQDRESAAAERAYDKEAADAVRSYSKIMKERQKSADDAEKDAERQEKAAEKAYDAEASAAVRSYSKIMKERQKAADDAEKEAERQAKAAERAYDKEAADAVRSYSTIMKEREKAAADSEKESERQAVAAEKAYDAEASAAMRAYSKIKSEREKQSANAMIKDADAMSGMMHPPGMETPGSIGYSKSVRDRANEHTGKIFNELIRNGHGQNLTPDQLSEVHSKIKQKVTSSIKENDRESAAASRADAAEEKRTAAIEARAQREAEAAERAADREAAAEAKKTQKKDEEEKKRSEQQIAQEKKVASVRTQYLGEMASGLGRATAGMATLATFAGDIESQKALRALGLIHGAHAVYGGVSTAGAGMAGAMGMSAGGAAAMATIPALVAAALGGALGFELLHWKEEDDIGYALQNKAIQKKRGAFHHQVSSSQREIAELHRKAVGLSAYTMSEEMADTAASSKGRRENFEAMRKDFEKWGTSSETAEQFQTRHARKSEQTEFESRNREHTTKLSDLHTRSERLQDAASHIETENEKISTAAEEAMNSVKTQMTEVANNPDFGWSTNEKGHKVGKYSAKQLERLSELGNTGRGLEVEETKALKENAEELRKIKEEELKIDQDIVKTLAEQNKSVAQYKQEAHDVVRREVAKDKAHDISVGSSDVGDMWARKRLQDKHDRIMKQREKNKAEGKDEFEGVEEYTQEEVRNAISSGDEAGETAEEQANRKGAAFGVRRRGWKDTKDAKDEADRRDKETEGLEEGNEEKMGKSSDETLKKGQELRNIVEESLKLNDIFDTLIEKMKQYEVDMQLMKLKANSLTTG